jgi:hypothetical protein
MDKVKEIETKLDQLLEKHRALAARHEALFETSKVMFALIDAPLPMVQHLLHHQYRVTWTHRHHVGMDDQYQLLVEAACEELQAVALAART